MRKTKNKTMIIAFITPALLAYLLIFLYPTLRTVTMSFFKVESVTDAISTWKFAAFDNYIKLFRTPVFVRCMENIGLIWLIGGLSVMVISLIFAVILTSGIHGKRFFRSVIYLPNVISAVAMATMWINYVYNPNFGFLTNLFNFLGMHDLAKTQWTNPDIIFWCMLVAYCFGMVGYHMLIWLSGIERIPSDYFEAAKIEGANVFQKFTRITFPLLKGVLRSNIVLWTVSSMAFFVWSQLFSPTNLSSSTVVPMSYMYQLVFGASSGAVTVRDSGSGAAIGVLLALVVVIIFGLTQRIVRNDDVEF